MGCHYRMTDKRANSPVIRQIFADTILELTKEVVNVELVEQEVQTENWDEGYVFGVEIHGAFQASVIYHFEKTTIEGFVECLAEGMELTKEEQVLYAIEYLNITCGRALSKLNNLLERASRLSVPELLEYPENKKVSEGEEVLSWSFNSKYGGFRMEMIYSADIMMSA